MKQLLIAIGLFSMAHASEDGLVLVPLPLDSIQEGVVVVEVPFIIGMALPDTAFSAIGHRYVPPSISFHEQDDINLASVAGIVVKPFHQSGRSYRIELDYGEVKEADQSEELLSAVLDCVYRVARQDEGYTVEVELKNLAPDSGLHEVLKRLTKSRDTKKESDKVD